ncbi:methyl-accepting chemotaxis protein [Pseudanabaena sp. Chao 1811]|uniref:methyl-accepting chemotaxis protein n=1 Tax=Pseudanabaena sp. Chao 1811 TaxID=2963092 RepID=UPI0022F40541|nr:methyl-accepting chemotaxis protein [Pseudanabaena sp. Chao 1811]
MMTAQYQAALHSYAEGRYEEAMQQFSELLYEDPRNPKLHIWLGATFRKAGKIEYAKVQYQQVLTLTDDPDLLDLASTSLAQIQNKLAQGEKKSASKAIPPKGIQKDLDNIRDFNILVPPQEVTQIIAPKPPELANVNTASHIIANDQDWTAEDVTVLAVKPDETESTTPQVAMRAQSRNGLIPPPPAIAALFQQQQPYQEEYTTEPFLSNEEPTEKSSTSSILQDTIADIQKVNQKDTQKNKKAKKSKQKKAQFEFPSLDVDTDLLTDSEESLEIIPQTVGNDLAKPSAIALEDMLKFSTVGQKITLWGAFIATIPAIILGVAAYKVGDGLLLTKVKQGQQSEAIALAKATESFLLKQTGDVGVLKTLLISAEVGQNTLQNAGQVAVTTNPSEPNKTIKLLSSLPITQQRQYKQLLTNRLNLYSQAYPQYTSIAVFSVNGELIAQSTNSKTLQTINQNTLSKVSTIDNPLISSPVVSKDGANLYVLTSVKSSVSQKVSMVLQVEIPVKTLVTNLTKTKGGNENSNFYVVDSNNKYVASSQNVTVGEDALADFAVLPNLRSLPSNDFPDLMKGDRNAQLLAYAPVANMQSYGMTWDVLTTIDKATAIAGNQNLLLVVGVGIAATPLLVAAIAYALSRRLSTRLKDIRAALRDLRQGNTDISFGALSVEGNDELADISLSINKMSEQFQTMRQKQEQEQQRLHLQVVKLFKVLSKLAREEKHEVQESDLSDENILLLGKKIRGEMVQRNAEVESYRQQKADLQIQLMNMLRDMQALADGDLTVSTKSIDGSLNDVTIFFDDVMRGLQNIVSQVKSSASQVNLSLGQNEQAIANLTSVSQRQVDTVTRSLNTVQMAKISANSITTNSQHVLQSSQLVVEKLLDSDRSIDAVVQKVGALQGTVANTAKRVKHLGEVSQKIAKAISSINEIAIKTNFLAINATLESSRSGGMGGGFVMVAEEVGELAARSVAATKEVESLLSSIQSETNAVMTAVESGSNQVLESATLAIAAKDSLLQISDISHQIDELVSSISDATISQVQTSEGVANLMKDISHIAKRNLAASSEVSKSLKATKKYSGELQQSLAHFKTR